jgi:hypothetical protein
MIRALAALAVLALLASTAGTALADTKVGCFSRTYDRAHLARHPDQIVTAVKLHIYRPPPGNLSKYWFLAQFTLSSARSPLPGQAPVAGVVAVLQTLCILALITFSRAAAQTASHRTCISRPTLAARVRGANPVRGAKDLRRCEICRSH